MRAGEGIVVSRSKKYDGSLMEGDANTKKDLLHNVVVSYFVIKGDAYIAFSVNFSKHQ